MSWQRQFGWSRDSATWRTPSINRGLNGYLGFRLKGSLKGSIRSIIGFYSRALIITSSILGVPHNNNVPQNPKSL